MIVQTETNIPLTPFLRWPGGKRWLVSAFPRLINDHSDGCYFEPFLGSAAVFAMIRSKKAVLSDLNQELITTYKMMREDPNGILDLLAQYHRYHSKSFYYTTRSAVPKEPLEVAARFVYLNRTCFNGIYRVNLKGQFNVPIGTRCNVLRKDDDFKAWSKALQGIDLKVCDFESTLKNATKGDLIFADPPYTVRHNQNAFRKYNESLFSWEDQIRLARVLTEAALRGVRIIITNANHADVSALYGTIFQRIAIGRNSSIAATAEKRGNYRELILWTKGALNERVLSTC